jgi:hypothetical protein
LTSNLETYNLPRMRRAVLVIVMLFSTAAAGEPELLFTAQWGGDAGLGIAGGKDSPVRGPTSAALDPLGNVWILDNLQNRLVGFDRKGMQIGVVPCLPVTATTWPSGRTGPLRCCPCTSAKSRYSTATAAGGVT